jgi:hypothetical protein
MGCIHGHAAQKASVNQDSAVTHTNLMHQSDPSEVLYVDSVLLNHAIPFRSSIERITEVLGKPDSIVSTSNECGGYFDVDTVRNFYYGRTWFEVYGDTAVIRDIDLGDGRFSLSSDNVRLDGRTRMSDIASIFPKSASQAYPPGVEEGKGVMLVRIKTQPECDDYWVLSFQDGQLVEIEYWIPC